MPTNGCSGSAGHADRVWPDEFFTDLDHNGPIPLYHQVSTRLERAIRSGDVPSGARLDNEVSIAQRLGVSRATARRSIQELVEKGLLVRRRGVGTQVVQGQVSRPLELTSLYEDLKDTGHEPSTQVLVHEVIPASGAVAEKLRSPKDGQVLHIRRLRCSDGTPIAVLENYLPPRFIEIGADDLEKSGLYQLLRARGAAIRIGNQSISARCARADEAGLLGAVDAHPVLTMERVAFDDAGEVVEYGTHCYRPDLYSFEATLVAR